MNRNDGKTRSKSMAEHKIAQFEQLEVAFGHVASMVTAANKRATGNFLEAQLLGDLTEFVKFFGR